RGELSPLASTIFFDDDPQTWLAGGVKGWEAWFLQERSETARWAPIGRLLQGATPVYAKTLISRLFTLCAQAHSAAAALLLFPEK
ncbi:hypothetical protein C4801_25730, partial [Salmonella enterica]